MPGVRIGIGVLLIALALGVWVTRKRRTRPPAFLNGLSRITRRRVVDRLRAGGGQP